MLVPLAATLQELSLQGCHTLRDRAGQHLQALTRLTQLDIGGVCPCQSVSLDSCGACTSATVQLKAKPQRLWLLSL